MALNPSHISPPAPQGMLPGMSGPGSAADSVGSQMSSPPVSNSDSAQPSQPVQPPVSLPASPVPASLVPTVSARTTAVQATSAQTDDSNSIDADDVTWINRARRVIRETQGDPHRQVQLLQHLRAEYLKQRFGRSVHTDEA